jgi:hypothetical protein
MADSSPPQRSLFPGLALVFVGLLLLVHSYRGVDIAHLFSHWWPLLIIFWGAIKLYERTVAGRSGQPRTSPISAGEILLVLGLVCLLGIVAGVDVVRNKLPWDEFPVRGDRFDFDLNVKPQPVPADSRISIRNGRGDISVRSGDDSQIHVDGKKNVKAWNATDAEQIASAIAFEIAKNGDGYEVRPANSSSDSRARVDLDISVPKSAAVTIRNERGDVSVSTSKSPTPKATSSFPAMAAKSTYLQRLAGSLSTESSSARFGPTKSPRGCALSRSAPTSPLRSLLAIWKPAREILKSPMRPGTLPCAQILMTFLSRTPAAN